MTDIFSLADRLLSYRPQPWCLLRLAWLLVAATAVWAALPGAAAAEVREYRVNQRVEFRDRMGWSAGRIERAAPPLYLLSAERGVGTQPFHWQWVPGDQLREPGAADEGPGVWDLFTHRRANDSVGDSQAEALEKYEQHRTRRGATSAPRTGSPTAPNSATSPEDQPAADAFAAPPLDHPVTEVDRSTVRIVEPAARAEAQIEGGAEGQADSVVDPVPLAPRGRDTPQRVQLAPGTGGFFEKPLLLAAEGRWALVVLVDAPPGKPPTLTVQKLNLRQLRAAGSVTFDNASLPRRLSPDGRRVAAVSHGFHSGSRNRLDLWDWPGGEPRHAVSFVPFDAEQDFFSDIEQLEWIDERTLVLSNRSGAVMAFDHTARAVWRYEGEGGIWAMSPGRRLVAVAAGPRVLLLDSRTGRREWTLEGLDFAPRLLQFAADGRTLVALGRERFRGWDLTSRQAHPSVALPLDPVGAGGGGGVAALDEGLLWVGGQLVEVATGRRLWLHQLENLPTGLREPVGDRLMVVAAEPAARPGRRNDAPGFTFHAWPLIGHADRELARVRATPPPTTLLEPGQLIALDLDGLDATAEQRQQIEAALTRQLTARGL